MTAGIKAVPTSQIDTHINRLCEDLIVENMSLICG